MRPAIAELRSFLAVFRREYADAAKIASVARGMDCVCRCFDDDHRYLYFNIYTLCVVTSHLLIAWVLATS